MASILMRRLVPATRRAITFRGQGVRYFAEKPSLPPNSKNPPSDSHKLPSKAAPESTATSNPIQPERLTDQPSNPSDPTPRSSTGAEDVVKSSPASLSLDFSPVEESAEQPQRTGAKSSKDSLSSIERRRRLYGRSALAFLGLGTIATAFYLGREWEDEELREKKMTRATAPSTVSGRMQERFSGLFDYFFKPSWEELLPPAIPPYAKPHTLLLSIDDLLVTSTWDRQNGWRTAKRPGVDYFLAYLSQFYEIVVFTSQHHYTAMPILEKLDPYNFFIMYKLFRESTRSINGTVKKDLTYLNRDLSKVILIDTDPDHVSLQPENAVVLPKWKGDPNDKGLVGIIPFLESIAIYKPEDVRPILQKYAGKDIAVEYGKTEAEAKQRFLESWEKSGKSNSISGPTLSGLFTSSSKKETKVPLTYLEQKRREAQHNYLEEQKYIESNREHFEQLLEADRKAAAEQMSGSLWSIMGAVAGPPQPPPSQSSPSSSTEPSTTADRSTTGSSKSAESVLSILGTSGTTSKSQ